MERNIWRKSTKSGGNQGQCVEVMETDNEVRVRDTKQSGNGPELVFTHAEWRAFVEGVKVEEFDL